jgi:murein DD-endopeptidase MepM/ murein hydrolase activator NlpD
MPGTNENKTDSLGDTQEAGFQNWWATTWRLINRFGLGETTVRLATHVLLVLLILVVAWGLREFYAYAQSSEEYASAFAVINTANQDEQNDNQQGDLNPNPTAIPLTMPEIPLQDSTSPALSRQSKLHTDVPTRPRSEVMVYTVEEGDTLFGIAEKFGLKPETILWGNYFVLEDNPHNLRPGQELNILPVNGTFHRWSQGDGLNGVASFFNVTPEEIIDYPGNNLDREAIGDWSQPNIQPGTWLIIPGGSRAFVSWSAPEIPRDNPGVAKVLGPGVCGAVADGAVGIGAFIWPANNQFLSGFDFNPGANHSGIDIDGETGDPVYAADNGVVVYAGWNNWGYGNVVVLNHGNGWQTLYAHLNSYNVGCGQSVYQGSPIGTIGSTGNSTGSHLHFEMMYNGVKVNPWDYLP